jgi:hypothetical protein
MSTSLDQLKATGTVSFPSAVGDPGKPPLLSFGLAPLPVFPHRDAFKNEIANSVFPSRPLSATLVSFNPQSAVESGLTVLR